RLFLGDPGGLGLIANHYGAAALARRSLVEDPSEPLWPLLARLGTRGARIVSIPRTLVERREETGVDASEALAVAERFEERLPPALRSLARLTVGLAAASAAAPAPRGRLRRLVDRAVRR
ncbi:MAG TPA: hypothetical protein VE269_00800, partial [Gaiellaceae bacterium]|nr:hypothetical protein [Gaiellaceae bacterium]